MLITAVEANESEGIKFALFCQDKLIMLMWFVYPVAKICLLEGCDESLFGQLIVHDRRFSLRIEPGNGQDSTDSWNKCKRDKQGFLLTKQQV